ncbi:2-phosphoglycolate phosphatase [Russula ochroleuca]|jgi:4-nitrophenyl phosphatase|uniref:4-nitrophenylphosphatase n=1 Tax=Russula ochroleuca TaxID=152965 RepID=A0A9P5MSJ1_9AGAM|nr:2-phosphoglycolate phosphatase [Russula ochroleuca]
MSVRLDTKAPERYQELLNKYDTWMFDCDGVLWHGDRLIDGAVEVLHILRSQKKRVLFVTNNATKSRRNYKKKFDGLGIEAHVDEVFGSAYAAAVYLSSVLNFPMDKRVYVIGMSGLEDELRSEGISFIGGTDPADNTLSAPGEIPPDPSVGAVLVGLDTSINYTKLSRAFRYLHSNPECVFLATNDDSTFPSEKGLLPGAGAILAPLLTALGPNRPATAIGKPNSTMLDAIKAKHDFDPERTIMVGDRLNTDIKFGKAGGLATLLVLTGITSEENLTGPSPSTIVPDYVTASIGDLRAAVAS